MTKNGKRVFAIVLILIVGGGGAGYFLLKKPPGTVVQTGRVERVDALDSIVSASGEVRAKEFVDLQTEIAGVIVELPVKEGDQVKKGDVLLRIDPFQTRQDVASAQAQFDAADAEAGSALVQVATAEAVLARDEFTITASKSEVTQSESNRDRLKTQLERKKGLYEKQIVSIDEYEAALSAYTVADSQVASARARLDQSTAERDMDRVAIDQWKKQHEAAGRRSAGAKANLERMQDLLAKTTITSPLTGVITKLNVEKGERAVPGILSNPQATLMTIADLSTIEAEIKVDETDIIHVALGNRATVTVDALIPAKLAGHVTEIGNSPIGDTGELSSTNTNQQGKDFKVVVQIDDPPAALRPGLSASSDIFVDRRENVLVIPLQAVTVREVRVDAEGHYIPPDPAELERKRTASADAYAAAPAAEDRKTPKKELEGVFVRDGDQVRFKPVKLGITGDSDVEVLDGLTETDEIVTGSYKVLRTMKEGDKIKVENRETDTPHRSKRSRAP
jgi:HlyD family secretion protein